MAITYNTSDIGKVKFNTAELSSVYYNGTEVWSGAELVDYTFPNENFKMTSNDTYGIKVYRNTINGEARDAYCAFDGTTDTAWFPQHTSTQDYGRIAIVFPFPILLQSVGIVNKSTLYASTAATVNSIETGYIYVSPTALGETDVITNMESTMEVYAELNRAQPSATEELYGYSTEHSNPDYADKWIQSIGIRGTTWGPGGTSSWKSIGEIPLKFKAKSTDLAAAGLL